MSNNNILDDTCKEVLEKFNEIKEKFETNSKHWRNNNQKISVNLLFEKSYDPLRNQLMNYFYELIQTPSNISIILRLNLDFKCWNLLVERINLVLKSPIDVKHFGKNSQVKIQNIYSSLLEDLKILFEFYRKSYTSIYKLNVTAEQEKQFNEDSPKYISNVLNFMGDIKKLKLTLNKRFYNFKDLINLEGDNKKDSEDAIKFFNYSLDNNIYNYNVYNNLAFIYREFLEDHLNSIYWNIRGLTYVFQKNDNNNKIRELLEKEFEIIRKMENKKKYVIQENVDDITYLKFDLEYFPILFCDIIGILFKKIDVDKLENHNDNLAILLTRILKNYTSISDNFKVNYEIYGDWSKMLLLSNFAFHYSLDNLNIKENNVNENNNNSILSSYSNESERITLNSKYSYLLNFKLYNHNITSKMRDNIKLNLKESLRLIAQFSKCVITNMNETNYNLIEKYLLIFFYWLSLNYDIYNLIIDEEQKAYLKFLNYYLRNHNEISKFLMPQTKVTLDIIVDKINNYILPIETNFICFYPIYRFFELNKKPSGIYRIQENKEISIMNKLILIHFLDLFGLYQQNDPTILSKFHANKNSVPINVKNVSDINDIQQNVDLIKKQLIKKDNILNIEKKEKPLIVLDASNIAMRHGEQKGIYSTKGIKLAIDYFTKNDHKVISFLPDYLFKEKDPLKHAKKRVSPDNLPYLYGLVGKGLVVKSPPQDYDDSYCIQYAKKHDAFIVSNDLFRDYIDNIKDKTERETERKWRDIKCISFTFVGDEFMPNPDAAFFKQFGFDFQEYLKKIKN